MSLHILCNGFRLDPAHCHYAVVPLDGRTKMRLMEHFPIRT